MADPTANGESSACGECGGILREHVCSDCGTRHNDNYPTLGGMPCEYPMTLGRVTLGWCRLDRGHEGYHEVAVLSAASNGRTAP